MRFFANCICCLAALTALAACGGGGGGGASPTPIPPAPTVSSYVLGAPAALGAALTGATLAEYNYSANGNANNGLAGINAMGAYRRGYWGQGVTVAVADSGVLTTHGDLSANIVAGKRADKDGNLFDDINDADGHGTHVAGIVAAAANNSGMMGVAPQAKIMPLQIGDPQSGDFTGNALSLFRHAANMHAPIVNNSWSIPISTTLFLNGNGDGIATNNINLPSAFLYSDSLYHSQFAGPLRQIVNIAAADMVFVWAAGNDGWNSETGKIKLGEFERTPQQLIVSATVAVGGQTLALRDVPDIGPNQYAAGYAGAPLVKGGEALAGKWLNVVALQKNGLTIASWSNGCGASKHFCVAAPGTGIHSADKDNNTHYSIKNGTSMAAPHASGALAVLKSRWQNLPMNAILAIMLHSTDDLGAAGVDEVYGQGKINLSLAAAREGEFNIKTGGFFVSLGSPAPLGAALTGTELAEYEYSASGHANNGLAGINAMGAYRRGYWGQGVTIAVVDSGVLTTHSDLSANIVAGKRADAEGNLHDDVGDPVGHGTHVAGIAAAAANNDGMMGVAPRAKIMPLQIASARDVFDGDELALLRHAATMQTPIVNNSWGDNIDVTLFLDGETYEPPNIDLPAPFVISLQNSSVSAGFAQIKSIAATADMVFVWAAGNSGWNSETGRVLVSLDENDPENLEKRFYATPQQLIASATVVFGGQTLALRNVPNMAEDMPAWGYQNAPLLAGGATLAGKWLNVVALNAMGDAIASFSNGCGASKHFCVAAPGVSIRSAFPTDTNNNGEKDDHFVAEGSSMAAPHASGALAVLKSRWQNLPMHVILAIMLHSTDDLGATGVDDVYGQGKINLSLAAAREGGFNIETGQFTVSTQPPQTGNFTETRIELSPLLAGLQPQLAGMSVATRFLGRYYQNINFGGFIAAAPAPVAPINAGRGAAAALLTPAAKAPLLPGLHLAMAGGKPLALHYENARAFARAELCHACAGDVWQEFSAAAAAPAPAFANSPRRGVAGIKLGNWRLYAAAGADEDGKNAAYTQTGAGWELKRKAYSFHADLYATQENKTFLGGKFAGAAAIGGGSLRGARLQAAATLPAGWRGFALAEGGVAAARFVSGSGIVGGKPARLAAYKLGASKNNLWHGGDNLRLGLQYHPRIVSGNLQTRFGVATNAVIKDERTQMEFHHQTAMQETTLSLKSARVVSAHIGYSRPLQRGGQLALALQHAMQEGKNQTALALRYQAEF